jgi:alpha-aminoadipate carrier protein LysW
MPTCIECQCALTPPDDAVEGEILPCPECATEHEIVGTKPFELALAPEVEEDWGE